LFLILFISGLTSDRRIGALRCGRGSLLTAAFGGSNEVDTSCFPRLPRLLQ